MCRRGTIRAALLLLAAAAAAACDLRPLSKFLDGAGPDALPADTGHDLPAADLLGPDAGPGCPGPPFGQIVDPGNTGGHYSAIAASPTGGVHISHHREKPAHGALHSWRATPGAPWQTETISSEGEVGSYSSIGLAPDGTIHVVFRDLTAATLVHATLSPGGTWQTQPLADTADDASDLAVGSAGSLHLVAYNAKNTEVVYLQRDPAGTWQPAVTLETDVSTWRRQPAVGISQTGVVHVCFGNGKGELVHRQGQPGSFSPAEVLDTGLQEIGADLAVAPDGKAHVIYNDEAAGVIKYVAQGTAGFDTPQELGTLSAIAKSYFGTHAAIAASDNGDLWVVYGDAQSALTVLRHTQDGWEPPLRPGFCCGSNLSAAVDPQGVLHIAHWQPSSDELRYTRICP
jgi:hypothetical protein